MDGRFLPMMTSPRHNNFSVAELSGMNCGSRRRAGSSYVHPLRDIEKVAPQIHYPVFMTSCEQPSVPVLVVGHTNPDTDAVCSALAYAAFHQWLTGEPAQGCHLNELAPETLWVLEHFQLPPPRAIADPFINGYSRLHGVRSRKQQVVPQIATVLARGS